MEEKEGLRVDVGGEGGGGGAVTGGKPLGSSEVEKPGGDREW